MKTTTEPDRVMAWSSRSIADVVLVDLHMPKHNGVEVCMNLLSLPAQRRPIVVAMSAHAGKDDIAVLRALGVRHFVPKDEGFAGAMSEVIRELRNGGPVPSQR